MTHKHMCDKLDTKSTGSTRISRQSGEKSDYGLVIIFPRQKLDFAKGLYDL